MEPSETLFDFVQQQSGKLLEQTLTHTGLTFISVLLAVAIGVPAGILITRKKMGRMGTGLCGYHANHPQYCFAGIYDPPAGHRS